MAIIVGGHETGLLDTSFGQLNRDDRTSESEIGGGEQLHINVSNGNLVLSQQDAFMPSRGMDFQLIRTYNSRGVPSDAGQRDDDRWSLTTAVSLNLTNEGGEQHFFVTYGDGSVLEYRLDSATGLYVSTDGQGAYETLEDLGAKGNDTIYYVVTRADQSRLSFGKNGNLLSWVDTNGVTTEFVYSQNRLVQVIDDDGHVLTYNYRSGNLVSIEDNEEGVLVQYRYDKGQLVEVVDRFGHSTRYFYSSDGFLVRMVLPERQTVDGKLETYESRELHFEYESVNWSTGDAGRAKVLTRMVDAEGNVTTFDYQFDLVDGGGDDKFYNGGTTRVVDALGNARATSNEALYVDWRVDNGYYATYDATLVQNNAAMAMHMEAIREAHSLTYSYRSDGYITSVTDQEGYKTRYNYDADGNLLSVIDSNGWGAVNSNSSYYQDLRESLGFPRQQGVLSPGQKDALTAAFTSKFTYDDRGNLLTSTDNLGNKTFYTYTIFNKLETITRPEGGVTTFSYDGKQNLIEQEDPGGDLTRWEYDSYGNLVKRIVFLDSGDLVDPAKQQVTEYFYDLYGNNVRTLDGEGHETRNTFDHFGNLTRSIDGNGGVTTYEYDRDNRLLSITDPLGHITHNSYDAVGNRISFTDANGKTITYIYDKNNRLVSTIDPAQSGPGQDRTTTRRYDVVGNELEVTDAEGRTTTYRYNARREVIDVITSPVDGADGTPNTRYTTSYAYDGEGNAITVTDNRGNSTQFLYYADGLLRKETSPIGHVTQYTYDANRNVLTILAGAQLKNATKEQKLTFAYDSEDQILAATDAEGNVTEYTYDAPGTIASITDGNGNRTDYFYDKNNRLIREERPAVIDPLTTVLTRYSVEHRLDAVGNEIETVDENGHSTFFEFDLDNRLVRAEDANGIVTLYAYDPNDNLTRLELRDSNNPADLQVTTFVYDAFDQLIAETDGVGNALASRDEPLYQNMRADLGFAALVADLSDTDKSALRTLYTERYAYDRVGNLLSVESHLLSVDDHEGRLTEYAYDNLNRLVLETDALGGTRAYRYDGNGNLVSELDQLGRERGYQYDAGDRLTEETDPLGAITQYSYDDFGNLVQRNEALGLPIERVSKYEYDRNNLLVEETDPENNTVAYQYDAVGNRIKVTDGRGKQTHFLYDALNRNIKVIDPLSLKTRFEYDGVGNQLRIIDPRNSEQVFTFDPGNRLITSEDGEGRTVSFEYDAQGNVVVQTTGVGGPGPGSLGPEVTRYEYDAEGNLRKVIDAEGGESSFDYDAVYNETRATDANGNAISTAYDALNRAILSTDALGGTTAFTYDAVGNTLSQTDPLGRVSSYSYDARNQLLTVIDPAGVETHYVNDVFNAVSITQAARTALARTRTFKYDGNDKLVEETDPLGGVTTYAYDENNNLVEKVDPLNHRTGYAYDDNNQLVEITDHLGGTTRYEYDDSGNRVRVTDALGNATTAYFNAANELVLSVDALGFATSSSYDINGNLVEFTQHARAIAGAVVPGSMPAVPLDATDRTTLFTYDKLNRLVSRTDPEGGVQAFSYDAVGNEVSRTDENLETTHYVYDELDRLVEVTDAEGGVRSYSYDEVGNQRSETDENGHTTQFEYDLLDRLVKRTNPLGGERLYTWDLVGNRLSSTDENGHTTTYEYDKLDRQVKRSNAAGGIALFAYDAVGNQVAFTDENGDLSEAFYDELYRLIKTRDVLGGEVNYTYDAFGNLREETDELGHSTFYDYDALNQLVATTNPVGGVRSLSYDAVGNVIVEEDETGRKLTNAYDGNNRLVSVTDDNGGVFQYAYDAAGNKVRETDELGKITHFAYDRINRLVTETDPLGGVQTTSYDAVGNVIQVEDENGNTAYLEYDANDRVVQQLTAEGYLSTSRYDAVGNELERREYNQTYAMAGANFPTPNPTDSPRVTTFVYDVLDRLISTTDSTGLTTHFEYDAVGNPTLTYQSAAPATATAAAPAALSLVTAAAITGMAAGTETVVYDRKGFVISRTDALGVETTYERDAKGNVLEMTEAAGLPEARTTTYTYDNADRLVSETNALGATASYTYDAAGRLLTQSLSGAGVGTRVESYEYDSLGRLFAEINSVGKRIEYGYDASGQVIRTTHGAGTADAYVNEFVYDDEGRLVAEIDGEGIRTEYVYDANDNKIETIQAKGVSGEERHTYYGYDAQNRLISITDPMGGTTSYEYDAEGNQFRITTADGTVTENTFDAEGLLLTNTVGVGGAHGGIRTTNVYDERGNVLSTTVQYADGSNTALTSTYAYDALDRVTRVTDPEGFYTSFEYDVFGNQVRMEVGQFGGDPADPRAARAAPQVTTFEYDAADHLVLTVDGEGNALSSVWDLHGNRIAQTSGVAVVGESDDADHSSTTTFVYDLDGKLVEKTSATGGQVKITRNVHGWQTRTETLQSAGVWVVEEFEYDSHGRVTAQLDSYGNRTEIDYDAVGNTARISRPGGRVAEYEYDLNSNLITETDPEGAATHYEYDSVGNRVRIVDAEAGSQRFYYNGFNQLVGYADAEDYFTAFELDMSGNTLRTTQYATALGSAPGSSLPTPVADSANDRVSSQTFDLVGNRLSETLANGLTRYYEYDSVGRLLRQTEDVSGADAGLLGRTHDTSSRVLEWAWDASGRLVQFTNADGVTESYSYDAAGNRLSETVQDPNLLATTGAVDIDRTTTYTYDLANRLLSQSVGGSTQVLAYDKAGNVVSNTDALGHATTTTYDLNNRVARVTDAEGQTISYAYDAVGNLVSTTDARGNTITLEYDLADRVISETTPSYATYTIDGGAVSGPVTTYNTYDALGRLVQRTDELGGKTSNWYDAKGNVVAELNVDGRLQSYAYNAFGEMLTLTTYKARFESDAFSLGSLPTSNADTTVVTNTYDRMGNVVSTTYPQITVTTVSGSGAAATPSTNIQAPVELAYFDAWDNLVESVDRNGVHSYSFNDSRGRQIALVDGGGYLTRTFYDSQDNVVRQSKYATALPSTTAGSLPTAPAGAVHTVDRYYDEQNRLVREVSPEVLTTGGNVRVTTTYSYDAAGNLRSRTLASGRAEEQSEYYYYDAVNQRTAVVTSNRVLNTFTYDGNGNLTELARYINPVAGSVDLATTSAAALLSGITTNSSSDQKTRYTYNSINLLTTQTDVMSSGGDIVSSFEYDAAGNLTRKTDPEGNAARIAYDAAGRIAQTITANGGYSFIEYDINGLKTKAWTGGDPDATAPVVLETSVSAAVSNGPAGTIDVSWELPVAGGDAVSWVAWSTDSKADLGNQAPSTAPGGSHSGAYDFATNSSGTGTSRSAGIPLDELSAGTTVFFRVVVKDASNNLSWSEERTLVVPARLDEVSIARSGADFVVEVEFDDAITNPVVSSPALAGDVAMTLISGNRYQATLSGVGSPTTAEFSFSWDYGGDSYSAPAGTLLRATDVLEDRDSGWLVWTIPSDGENIVGSTQLLVVGGAAQTDGGVVRALGTVQYEPDTTIAQSYNMFYGDLVAESHSLGVSYTDHQTRTATVASYNTNDDDEIVSTNWNLTWVSDNDGLIQTAVSADFDAAELARVNGDGVSLGYRVAGDSGDFTTVAMTAAGNTRSAALDLEAETGYDIKIFYTDTSGREVIADWRHIDVPGESANASAGTTTTSGEDNAPAGASQDVAVGTPVSESDLYSLTVLASERDGLIGAGTAATRVVSEGVYTGPVDPTPFLIAAALDDTGGAAGSLQANGYEDGTYFTLIEYNDLGMKVASNEDTGLWRTYGLDANGNRVHTRLYGVEGNNTYIDTFAAFDTRNNETSRTGPEVNGQAPVTTRSYDYENRVLTQLEPGTGTAKTYAYDGVGNLVSESDALGYSTQYRYDALGNLVQVTDPNSHVQNLTYTYTGLQANRLTSSAYAGLSTATETYGYDAFGRRTSLTKGVQSIAVTYDQHDRVTTVTDALAHTTRFYYDKLDRQTWMQDANGNFFGRAYNPLGFVTHEYSFTSSPSTLASAQSTAAAGTSSSLIDRETVYDVFNNKIAEIDAEGRSESFTYGAFGRLESARGVSYTYDDFGRQIHESDSYGRDITREYDAAGRLTRVDDEGTDTATTYTYDIAGNRRTEVLTIDGSQYRSQTYTYNARGELTQWRDTAPSSTITTDYTYWEDGNIKSIYDGSKTTNYTYDAADRVTLAGSVSFTYDAAGNRATSTDGSTTVTYTYDAGGRLDYARIGSSSLYDWSYDAVGNITYFSQVGETTYNTYDDSYRLTESAHERDEGLNDDDDDAVDTVTTTTYDRSGRTLATVVVDSEGTDDEETYSYFYFYDARGLQTYVIGVGAESEASGGSTSTYDVNGRLIEVNLGQGDDEDQESDEINTFYYDNDGKIVRANRDDGIDSPEDTYYLYALGYAVGEYTSAASPTINEGNYATVKVISPGFEELPEVFPDTTVKMHTVAVGDTLRSLASQYYGSPDLWFVIAEANGMLGTEALQVGSNLLIPATAQNAYHTAETHTLYKEGDIIGSTLPNLASPPADSGDTCAIVAAIILIVVVAIVAIVVTVVTVGAAAPAAAAALGLTAGSVGAILVGVAVGVVVGAAIAFVASVATQAILVGFGLQDEFDWKAVAADTVAGALGGAAAGLGAAVSAVRAATTTLRVVNIVGQVALEAAGETASQAIQNDGEIANPWLIVAAGAGGGFGAVADLGNRFGKAATKVADLGADAADTAVDVGTDATKAAQKASKAAKQADEFAATADLVDYSTYVAKASGKKFNGDVFATVFKAKFTETTKPIVETGKSIRDNAIKAKKAIGSGLKSAGSGLSSAGSALKKLPSKAIQAVSEFRQSGTVFKGEITKTVRYFDTVDGVRVAKYKQVIRESAKTAFKGETTKVIRSIDDATGQIKYTQVLRESVAGTSKLARLKAAPGKALSAAGSAAAKARDALGSAASSAFDSSRKALSSAADATVKFVKDSKQAIKEFRESGTVFKGEITKTVRYFETVDGVRVAKYKQVIRESAKTAFKGSQTKVIRSIDDATGQIKYTQVLRESVAGTSKLARLKRAPGAALEATGAAFDSAKAAIKRAPGQAKDALGNARTAAVAALKKANEGGQLESYGGLAGSLIATGVESQLRSAENEEREANGELPLRKTRIRFDRQLAITTVAIPAAVRFVSPLAYLAGEVFRTNDPDAEAPGVEDAFITKPRPEPEPIDDLNALTTYATLHNRQYNWLALNWTDVAASTTTGVFSPFAIDRSAGAGATLASHRLFAGQVSEFDMEQVVANAERAVGGVGGSAYREPGQVT